MLGKRETKILATLGPATMTAEMISNLIGAGADGFRLNMGHLNAGDVQEKIDLVRSTADSLGQAVAVVVDLSGPKIRTGALPQGQILLEPGNKIVLGRDIPVSHPQIIGDIKVGERILLDDGNIELKALDVTAERAVCRVVQGGELKQGKGINLPDTDMNLPVLTEKDLRDIEAVVDAGADYMSLSFVQTADDIEAARAVACGRGRCPQIIAKIERPRAVDNFDAILDAADGIMIARGDLGVELPPERVPMLQKEFIRKVNSAGKIVITATQMLESMISNPRPTRAEASDVANAVCDGTDAVMLSGETAVGRYPAETVSMMRSIIGEAERVTPPRREIFSGRTRIHSLAAAAVHAAESLQASAIIAITISGYTAQMIAQQRPRAKLIAVVPDEQIRNCLTLLWGATPLLMPLTDNFDEFINSLENKLLNENLIEREDTLIFVSGSTKIRGLDYIMKIDRP